MPNNGNYEVRDIVGMGCALHNLDNSRIKGKWKDQLQWDSMSWTPTWYKNSWKAREGSLEEGTIYSANDKKVYEYSATTASIQSQYP